MRLGLRGLRLVAVAALPVGLALAAAAVTLWPPEPMAARWGPGDCRRLALVDAESGDPVVGVEDIARDGDSLVLSAQDRLAARTGLGAGGLYRLSLGDLDAAGPLALPRLPGSPDHPHGIAVEEGTGRIAAVARRVGPRGVRGAAVIVLDGERVAALVRDPRLCAANDLAWGDGLLWISIDRARCPRRSLGDMLFPEGRGRLLRLDPETGAIRQAVGGLTFPNGVLWRGDGLPVVAETRAGRLRVADADPAAAVALPGGPDNLTRGPEGGIVAALHPRLLHLGLHLAGWTARAPSRIVRVDGAGAVEGLFDDPRGRLWPGATVALLGPDGLVAGAARAPGLLVCGRPA